MHIIGLSNSVFADQERTQVPATGSPGQGGGLDVTDSCGESVPYHNLYLVTKYSNVTERKGTMKSLFPNCKLTE